MHTKPGDFCKVPRTYIAQRIGFPISGAGKTGDTCRRMSPGPYPPPHSNINSRWIRGLNVSLETVLEENTGEILPDTGVRHDFLDKNKSTGHKAKLDKQDYIKFRKAKGKKSTE